MSKNRWTQAFAWVMSFSVLFMGCSGDSDDEGTQSVELRSASAPSNHYVEVDFSGQIGEDALNPDWYRITGPDGAVLPVRRVSLEPSGTRVLLVTDSQSEIPYELTFARPATQQVAAGAVGGSSVPLNTTTIVTGSQSTTFEGSTGNELLLLTAIALDNTHVLLTFDEEVQSGATNIAFYRIVAPTDTDPSGLGDRLDITGATLGSDGLTVVLTTTAQKGLQYAAIVTNVRSRAGSRLIDPTRNVATFFGQLPVDTVRPRVTGAVATSATTVLVSFNEPVDEGAGDARNYAISPTVAVTSVQLNEYKTQALLTTQPLTVGTTYTVTVTNVLDPSRNPMDLTANSAQFIFNGSPATNDPSLPRLVGAASTGNTSVIVQFSKPMGDSVLSPTSFIIVQPNQQSEAGFLSVTQATFAGTDRMSVSLTTRSQSELTYQLTAVNVRDLAGNALAPRQVVAGVVVDPSTASFPGTPPTCPPKFCDNGFTGVGGTNACASDDDCVADPPCAGRASCDEACVDPCLLRDADEDGLNDNEEQRGWVVTVTRADGTTSRRDVTADPDQLDSDRDTLSDALEKNLGTDPRDPDTDDDQLTDDEEYNEVYSDPTNQDSDRDGISDSLEVEFFKTNAIVADSDGDGYTDSQELFEMSRDARIADPPMHEIEVGEVSLKIDERFTYTDEDGDTRTETSNTQTTLTTSHEFSTLDSETVGGGFIAGIEDCQSDCKIEEPTDIAASIFLRAKLEGNFSRFLQFDEGSVDASSRAFEQSLEKARELSTTSTVTREVFGAAINAAITLRNTSDVAFSLSNVEVSVFTVDADDPTRLIPVATLVPQSTLVTGSGATYNLGPNESRGPVVFSNREVYPAVVEDLMRAPRGLVLKISNFDVTTRDGKNFAYGLQAIREQTAGIGIDFGDGNATVHNVITAGVLSRARDDLRCAPTGNRPNAVCEDDDDCGTSTPCAGGDIIGGFAGYGGTGAPVGIPLDFVLQDILGMRRTTPPVIVAGENGEADTDAQGDDVQVVAVGEDDLSETQVIVAPGRNGVLDTVPEDDDVNPEAPDGVLSGPNANVETIAEGDDVQLVPVGTRGVPAETVIVAAGENGVLDSELRGDDIADVVTGYEVSQTCNPQTPFAILAGPNGVVQSTAQTGVCLNAFDPHVVGETCSQDLDCGEDTVTGEQGICDADAQLLAFNTGGHSPDAIVIGPGATEFVSSIPGGDDVLLAPGMPCTTNNDCRVGATGGSCTGPQVIVRVDNRRRGQFRRFWALMLPDDSQIQTDVGQIRVRPGDMIALAFIQDLDRDGLSSEAEFLYGSSDFNNDTDGDTLFDFVETRIGWEVGVVGQPLRRIFPDPRRRDSDGDGVTDKEESDFRILQCECVSPTSGPQSLVGSIGNACVPGLACGGGTACRDVVHCTASPCPPCSPDQTLNRIDPRRSDTDSDSVSDFAEVFGFLTGAGVVEPLQNRVILAGRDNIANSLACPLNRCADDATQHCQSDGDCVGRRCLHPVPCDDIQVVAQDDGVLDPRAVVIAPGPRGRANGVLFSSAGGGDELFISAQDNVAMSSVLGDDIPVVGLSGNVVEANGQCVDGSRFAADGTPLRFPMCGIAKPGPNGEIESRPAGDDVLIAAGAGQRIEWTDPLNPDTDLDEVFDGNERSLGSSPSDPGDTGLAGDRDQDGLTDNQERSGWTVNGCPTCPRAVASNPNLADSDVDGLPDYAEAHMPCRTNTAQECPTDPTNADTDGDGLSDFDELGDEQIARLDRFNAFFPGYTFLGDDSRAYGTDGRLPDTDGDTLTDNFELFTGWSVLLADGSVRHVLSNPAEADTDADRISDSDELDAACADASAATCPIDPRDPDTDDDGRLDGVEISANTDPLEKDMSVTVTFRRIEIDTIEDPGGAEGAEFGWWFLVRSPSLGTNPVLVSDSRDQVGLDLRVLSEPAIPGPGGGCAQFCTCFNVALPEAPRWSIPLVSSTVSFALKEGEAFTVEGLLAEVDGASNDCGVAPNWVPTWFRSQCFTRFNKVYNFNELGNGGRGETLAVNPADSGAAGGDTCAWNVQMTIEVH